MIPIPFFVLDTTIQAIADLAIIIDLFLPIRIKRPYTENSHRRTLIGYGDRVPINIIVKQCMELVNELRRYGRWRMVQVETEEMRVYIDFW